MAGHARDPPSAEARGRRGPLWPERLEKRYPEVQRFSGATLRSRCGVGVAVTSAMDALVRNPAVSSNEESWRGSPQFQPGFASPQRTPGSSQVLAACHAPLAGVTGGDSRQRGRHSLRRPNEVTGEALLTSWLDGSSRAAPTSARWRSWPQDRTVHGAPTPQVTDGKAAGRLEVQQQTMRSIRS